MGTPKGNAKGIAWGHSKQIEREIAPGRCMGMWHRVMHLHDAWGHCMDCPTSHPAG